MTGARISPQNLDHSIIISPQGNCVKFNLFDHWGGGGEILSEQVLIPLFPSGIILATYELHSPFWIRIKILSQTRNGDVKGALLDDTVMSLAVSQAERRSRMAEEDLAQLVRESTQGMQLLGCSEAKCHQ